MARPKGKYQKPVLVELTCAYVGCSETFTKKLKSPKRFCTTLCGAREYWRMQKIQHAIDVLSRIEPEVIKDFIDYRSTLAKSGVKL
jgi:hypothetical protein